MPPDRPSHPIWRGVKIAAGLFMLALGVVGLFLPFLQGILFMLIGLALLSTESSRVRHLLDRVRARYPELHAAERRFVERMKSWFRGRK